jgi:hypothetical protein
MGRRKEKNPKGSSSLSSSSSFFIYSLPTITKIWREKNGV